MAALQSGASPDATDDDDVPALALCEQKHLNEIAHELLRRGANKEMKLGPNADSLLHQAARHGNFGFAALLVANHHPIDPTNNRGETPLHLAVYKGNSYLAQFLLSHGANVNASTINGRTPYSIACRKDDSEMLQLLKKHNVHCDHFDFTETVHEPSARPTPTVASDAEIIRSHSAHEHRQESLNISPWSFA